MTDFLGLITTKLEELAAINPYMEQITTQLRTNVSPAMRTAFNLHLLDSVGLAFAFSNGDIKTVLGSQALQNNPVLKNMILEMLANVKPVSLADFPSLARLPPEQVKAVAANTVTTTAIGVLAKHARQIAGSPGLSDLL
ncbi:hypothetical protein AMAG_09430 [Allomyces macrogynus ATCC 38327]|uniref:Uncharacterized protein n=1 Tax=Allomyces macrogynus (strain ATCC 38327) TaxID=578462 RepID=A0A0L0SPK0_ALLM3|nr:hypothetical protein AMAG_09430 [Allomyces macrogynus ATCC 38327]|eukprot:KNE64407.1 hypothetical protein AMAG_09430 [Allomyces macrogynus ATCC 38327]